MARKSGAGFAKKSVAKDPSYKKMKPEYYPVQLSYQMGVISDGPYLPAPYFHSVPRALAEVNHRLYRTGRRYTMKIDIDNDAAVEGNTVDVYALADTWWTANAFAAARAAYETALAEERASLTNNQLARWNDFIPANGFSTQIVGAFMAQTPGTSAARDDGEHLDTTIVDKDGNTRTFTWGRTTSTGAGGTYSIVTEYDNMGNVDDTPESSVTGGYNDIDSNFNSADLNALQTRGDLPPYSRTLTKGSNNNYLVKVATLRVGDTGSQRLSTGFFNAPCGFVWFDGVGPAFPNAKLTVTVKGGDYKGTHSLSMAE